MLRFALKNMAIKKIQTILIVLSIVVSAGIAVLAYNVANQVRDGITKGAGYYSVIIGPSGSQTQLAMNTMYFTDEPIGTIPYSVATDLMQDGTRVKNVVPFAMADNYNGCSVVGTSSDFLKGKTLKTGALFADDSILQAVVGYKTAKNNHLNVGDVIHTGHSVNSSELHAEGITVVGILEETHSAYDNIVFTQLRTLWKMHEHAHDNEEETAEHTHNATVCALLINAKNPAYAMQLVAEYDGKVIETDDGDVFTLQAIEPMAIVRDVLNEADDTQYIVFVLCGVILLMNIMIISINTILNMYHSAKEISLMRLIGISMKKINLLYLIQNGIIGFVSTALAFGLSKICLSLMNDYVSSMGVVLNMGMVYPMEIVILLGVFLISIIPTAIWTFCASKKDGIVD